MAYLEEYARWSQQATDPDICAELAAIRNDDLEQKARFSTALAFGTAGLRGVLGAGTSRMNIYTVRDLPIMSMSGLAAAVLRLPMIQEI